MVLVAFQTQIGYMLKQNYDVKLQTALPVINAHTTKFLVLLQRISPRVPITEIIPLRNSGGKPKPF